MSKIQLEAVVRSKKGKTANQSLRKNGDIPAVLYGDRGNILLEMAEEQTRHMLEKMTGMHELLPINVSDTEGGESWTANVLLREVQRHPYKQVITHLDFWEISEKKEQIFKVPIKVIGESPGVKSGGVLQMVVRDIPVFCLPSEIPSLIEIDSSMLDIGDSVRIHDVKLPEKVTHSTEENYAVISIVGRVKEEVEDTVVDEQETEADEEAREESPEEEEKKEN